MQAGRRQGDQSQGGASKKRAPKRVDTFAVQEEAADDVGLKRSSSGSDNSRSGGSDGNSSGTYIPSLSSGRYRHQHNGMRAAGKARRREGEMGRTTDSSANTEFMLLSGRCHFKSKRTGAPEDCTNPPKAKCVGQACRPVLRQVGRHPLKGQQGNLRL